MGVQFMFSIDDKFSRQEIGTTFFAEKAIVKI
jgi:hypothetical protein